MKLKDIFKIAVVGAAGWAGGQIAGPIGKKIGTALGSSLLGTGGMGSGGPPASQRYVPTGVNLRQFSMPTYAMTQARGSQMSMIPTNAEALQVQWESRLNRYLLRRKALSERTVVKV